MKADMHIHSIYSPDGRMEIRHILKLARKKGLGAIAITDHNEIKGALFAEKLKIMPVIKGIEISTASGHVLAYGVEELIPRGLSIEETIEKIKDLGGIAVAAHPYRFWSGIGEENVTKNSAKFDAIEVFNGRCSPRSNSRARELATKLRKPLTAGSDAHFPDELGKAGIIVHADSPEEILEAVLKGDIDIFGQSRSKVETARYVIKAVTEWIGRGFKKI